MHKYLLLLLTILASNLLIGQSTIITSGNEANIQVPKLSYEQINNLSNPKSGMVVYDSTFHFIRFYNGSKWMIMSGNSGKPVGFAWKKGFNYQTYHDQANNIVTDASKNVYVIGWIGSPYSYKNSYVAKFSNTGLLIWESTFDSGGEGISLVVDSNNNVYVVSNGFGSLNYSQITIRKFNSNGTQAWSTGFSGQGGKGGRKIFLDNSNNVYITGKFSSTMYINSTSISPSVPNESFVAKFSNNGIFNWVKGVKNSEIIIASNGDCFFGGYFSESINIDNNTFNSFGNEDTIFGKYNSSGVFAWAKQGGGNGVDKINDIAVDVNGYILITGSFSNSANFDGNYLNSSGLEDMFIAKYQNDGSLSWIKQGGGEGNDRGLKIANSSYDPCILGEYSGMASFSNFAIYPTISPSKFIVKYSGYSGDVYWVRTIERASEIRISPTGSIYTWTIVTSSGLPPYGMQFSFSKYSSDGLLIYTQLSDGLPTSMAFGYNGGFGGYDVFIAGSFGGTVNIGSTILTSDGDIFVSRWIEE